MTFFLYNFFSFFLIISSTTLVMAQDTIRLPKQILNLSSDVRVATNALLADKSKRQLSLIDSESLSESIRLNCLLDLSANKALVATRTSEDKLRICLGRRIVS